MKAVAAVALLLMGIGAAQTDEQPVLLKDAHGRQLSIMSAAPAILSIIYVPIHHL
jgi:hypothetical protein